MAQHSIVDDIWFSSNTSNTTMGRHGYACSYNVPDDCDNVEIATSFDGEQLNPIRVCAPHDDRMCHNRYLLQVLYEFHIVVGMDPTDY